MFGRKSVIHSLGLDGKNDQTVNHLADQHIERLRGRLIIGRVADDDIVSALVRAALDTGNNARIDGVKNV